MADDTTKEKEVETILVFDASLQKEVPHTIDVDGNGEITLTSTESDRTLKFPEKIFVVKDGKETEITFQEALELHKQHNEGQRSQASIDKKRAEIIAGLTGGTVKKDKK